MGDMSPEVAQLVDYLWEETSGKLKDVLAVPVESMKTEQVRDLLVVATVMWAVYVIGINTTSLSTHLWCMSPPVTHPPSYLHATPTPPPFLPISSPPLLPLPSQVEKAEAALLSIRRLLDDAREGSPDPAALANMSKEFYSALPHQAAAKKTIDSKRLIAQKQDLCQVR